MKEAFAEMARVLKLNRWLTVFFHNRDFRVWNSLKQAVEQAGFTLEAVTLHYPAVTAAKTTLSREGSLLGDLVLQFRKIKNQQGMTFSLEAAAARENTSLMVSDEDRLKNTSEKERLLNLVDDVLACGNDLTFDEIFSQIIVRMWRLDLSFGFTDLRKLIDQRLKENMTLFTT
jgi:hypothetical protein